MNLSKAAQKSLKKHGFYKCKAPQIPYRVMLLDEQAVMGYNKDYLMGMVRALNEGACIRWADGKVHDPRRNWVYASAIPDDHNAGVEALAYIHFFGFDGPVAVLFRGNVKNVPFVDFTSRTSDAWGFYHMPVGP